MFPLALEVALSPLMCWLSWPCDSFCLICLLEDTPTLLLPCSLLPLLGIPSWNLGYEFLPSLLGSHWPSFGPIKVLAFASLHWFPSCLVLTPSSFCFRLGSLKKWSSDAQLAPWRVDSWERSAFPSHHLQQASGRVNVPWRCMDLELWGAPPRLQERLHAGACPEAPRAGAWQHEIPAGRFPLLFSSTNSRFFLY